MAACDAKMAKILSEFSVHQKLMQQFLTINQLITCYFSQAYNKHTCMETDCGKDNLRVIDDHVETATDAATMHVMNAQTE